MLINTWPSLALLFSLSVAHWRCRILWSSNIYILYLFKVLRIWGGGVALWCVLWALPHLASKVYYFYLILSIDMPEQINLEILAVFYSVERNRNLQTTFYMIYCSHLLDNLTKEPLLLFCAWNAGRIGMKNPGGSFHSYCAAIEQYALCFSEERTWVLVKW